MQWQDDGIVLGTRRHGETSLIVELMTRRRGRHLGLVRGGRSRRMRPVLQPGNRVQASWRARLDEHLGHYTIEPVDLRAAQLMESPIGIYGVQLLAAHLRLLPERDAHENLFNALTVMLEHLGEPAIAAELLVRFEIEVLNELGFGLNLTKCAATGERGDLAFVSPRTGRAVSRQAGKPYADKLLPLPDFLLGRTGKVAPREALADMPSLLQGFELTGYFLARHVWEPRGLRPPDERAGLIGSLRRALGRPVQSPVE